MSKPKFTTLAEAEEWHSWAFRSADHVLAALSAVKTKFKSDGAHRSSVPCPRCGGTIEYLVSGPRNHSQGVCQTADCLSWIE